jgi:rhodanese-related sulfurtransferase
MMHSSGFLKIFEEAKKVIQEMDLPTLESLVEAREEFYLVDVREAEEYKKGCISRAIH